MTSSNVGSSLTASTTLHHDLPQAALPSGDAGANSSEPASMSLMGTVMYPIVQFLPGMLYWIITFVTITLPTWIFTIMSMSLTFTMNVTTLLLIFLAIASAVTWLVRYRFLNMYERLPAEAQREEPQVEVFPDTQEGDTKRGLSNYLDEFLTAIKVFGYLEKPVFHELTRTMQTRKLMAGETLMLEEEKGFLLVVDGLVQIFVKSNRDGTDADDDDAEDERDGNRQGYQLLTEVKNGAPMSSLFSILSLFTEDVKLRHGEDDEGLFEHGPASAILGPRRPPMFHTTSTGNMSPALGGESPHPDRDPSTPLRSAFTHRRASSRVSPTIAGGYIQRVPYLSLDGGLGDRKEDSQQHTPKEAPLRPKSAHPDILARAKVDTTIAIIPATAFRRLTKLYPKASAHIVQVILTRLQRVTLATGHAYLGLTSEVLRTEKLMNKYTAYDLPGFLRDEPLKRVKEKFSKERERLDPDEVAKGIALHNPRVGRRRGSSLKPPVDGVSPSMPVPPQRTHSYQNVREEQQVKAAAPTGDRDGVSAGDLLTNTHLPKRGQTGRTSFSQPYQASGGNRPSGHVFASDARITPFTPSRQSGPQLRRQDSIDEDNVFREAVLDCMFKGIGLKNAKSATHRTSASVEQSPVLISFDSRKHKAVFNNAFGGLIDPYEAYIDGDSDSVASASVSAVSGGPSPSPEELACDVEIVFFPKDSVLVEQGERNPGLYYVIDGFLDVSVPAPDDEVDGGVLGTLPSEKAFVSPGRPGPRPSNKRQPSSAKEGSKSRPPARKSLFLTKPGGLAGYLGTVSSYRSFVDVVAKTDVYVGFLPRTSIERIVEKYPVVLLTMAKRLTSLLPRLILHIDFALEWKQVNAGQVIYNQGDESDAIYIVLNGRLRSIREREGKITPTGEYGQGDSVGELEVLTETPRSGSLHAVRDTELAKFPKTLFNSLAFEHPGITIKISKILATRMRTLVDDPLRETTKESASIGSIKTLSNINLRTIAILPVSAGVPLVEFGSRLMSALTQTVPDSVASLNQAAILNHLGRHAFSRMGKLKLAQYLADLEEKYNIVLYVCDTNVKSPWTQTCISQADSILLVGLAEGSPNIGEYERYLLTTKSTARKELVLLHSERYVPPGLTRKWLRNRVWINGSHYHIQMPYRAASDAVSPQPKQPLAMLKQRVQTIQAEIQKYTSKKVRQTPLYSAHTPFKGDFHRLARRLCGKSVGLVLGGGGARGICQIGVIRALEEAGVPIDIVGGTSIGSFVGALYAWDADVVPMYGRAKKFAGRMASLWRFALDLTYPATSYTTGHEFNRGIYKTFGNSMIEDFWLEFYTNTTNITQSRPEFHTSGYVWRYVRASMSLAGLIPPICDNGMMLVDGGYVDNLTVGYMKSLGADVIFAIDVGSRDDTTPQQFGDSMSGFWALFNRWNPFTYFPNPPTLPEIQARLAYVSSVDALERAKTTPGCRYMRPPIDHYGTLEFGSFEEIYEVGYKFGQEYLRKLREEGSLPGLLEETEKEREVRRTMAPRRASI